MITNSDLKISNQSYTKKDFYQIFPEAVEWIKELTNIWNPEDTNESDPGVILVKLAAFIADKLNYNIDKNILETFITSATQEDSFRKICEMMGYNMKYYNSATTQVSFMWLSDLLPEEGEDSSDAKVITLPKFDTVITNESGDIHYVLMKDVVLSKRYVQVTGPAIEGELVKLDINDNGVLLATNLDDKNRFYLPEYSIAENGIWIYDNTSEQKEWDHVDNLNTQLKGKRVWKFGFDSQLQIPYIQFPDDVKSLLTDGLIIYYIRTSGVAGNINAGTLNSLVNAQVTVSPALNSASFELTDTVTEEDSTDKIAIKNLYATTNGSDIQTLDEAYNGFKKVVGTFDTLTTCRDYANAIYNMVVNEKEDNTPLVSNCQVSDIRNELNFANTVVTYTSRGVTYDSEAEKTAVQVKAFVDEACTTPIATAWIKQDKMTNFDLYIYPLNPIKTNYTRDTYLNSFKPLNTLSDNNRWYDILTNLEDYKTISHKIKQVPLTGKDLYLIKNYYSLKAKIVTNYKVNKFEQSEIKNNIYTALYKNFNARQLEYGEEIPYDTLLKVIQNADARIQTVVLDEPDIEPYYMLSDGDERPFKSSIYYNKMVAKNVLAGRVPLFDYNTEVVPDFTITNDSTSTTIYGNENTYYDGNPSHTAENCSITYISTNLTLNNLNAEYTLTKNENLQIVSPRLVSDDVYPMYVMYHMHLANSGNIPANTNYELQAGDALYVNYTDNDDKEYFIKYYLKNSTTPIKETTINGVISEEEFSGIIQPNFILKDSLTQHTVEFKTWAKTKEKVQSSGGNWPTDWTIEGLYSLATSQEIAIQKFSEAELKQKAYIYWLSNANNTLTFTKVSAGKYECLLGEGEYLFYTNQAKTDLVTLGSGTRLTLVDPNQSGLTVSWILSSETSITKDDVAQNGIGAFANSDWIQKDFNSTYYLKTAQTTIVNLAEGDKITNIVPMDEETSSINSTKWTKVNSITYVSASGKSETQTSSSKIIWEVRPILNIDFGPDKTQSIKANQSIVCYSNEYVDGDGKVITNRQTIINALNNNPSSITEKIDSQAQVCSFNANTEIRSNLYIQRGGGQFISVHTAQINGSNKDDLKVYPVIRAEAKYNDNTQIDFNEGIDFSSSASSHLSASLPLYIPKNTYCLVTLFAVSTDVNGVYDVQGTGKVVNYKDYLIKGLDGTTDKISLSPGLNILLIQASSTEETENTLTLSKHIEREETEGETEGQETEGETEGQETEGETEGQETEGEGTEVKYDFVIQVLSSKLVNCKEGNTTGLNYDVFKIKATTDIPTDTHKSNFFTSYFKDIEDFYATVDINNNMVLDTKDMSDPLLLFNYNNEVNDFVLAELDVTSFTNIEIASSSKLN